MNEIYHYVKRPCSNFILQQKQGQGSEGFSFLAPKPWDLPSNSIKSFISPLGDAKFLMEFGGRSHVFQKEIQMEFKKKINVLTAGIFLED